MGIEMVVQAGVGPHPLASLLQAHGGKVDMNSPKKDCRLLVLENWAAREPGCAVPRTKPKLGEGRTGLDVDGSRVELTLRICTVALRIEMMEIHLETRGKRLYRVIR